MFVTTNKKIGYIHIPKCGGTSVFLAFDKLGREKEDIPWSPWPIAKTHAKYVNIENKLDLHPEIWFTSIRNPYARFHTWYYFIQEWDKKRLNGELPLKGQTEESLQYRIDFYSNHSPKEVLKKFDNLLSTKENKLKHAVSNISTLQYAWVKDCPNIKIFKLEKINEMWDWLKNIGCPVDYTHAKKNDNKLGSWQDFDEETLLLIQKRWADDFEKFGYELVVT